MKNFFFLYVESCVSWLVYIVSVCLIDEVCLSLKLGLVDSCGNGVYQDLNLVLMECFVCSLQLIFYVLVE